MKKTLALLLAALLTLSACGGPSGGPAEDSVDADRSFSHLGLQCCDTENTLYFIAGQTICYVDKDTGIGGPLCGKPECTHDGPDCDALLPDGQAIGLSYYRGRLYWCDDDPLNGCIYSMAPDGTDRRAERALERELLPMSAQNERVVIHRGYVYLSCVKGGIVDGARRNSLYVCAFPLETDGDGFVILDREVAGGSDVAVQPWGDGLYIVGTSCVNFDSDAGGGPPEQVLYDFSVLRWDAKEKTLEELCHNGGVPFYSVKELWVAEDGITFCGITPSVADIWHFDFSTGELESRGPFEEEPNCQAAVWITDGLLTGCGPGGYIVIRDLQGETLVETTFPTGEDAGRWRLCGADAGRVFFCSDHEGISIIAVPLGGGEIKTLCTVKTDRAV